MSKKNILEGKLLWNNSTKEYEDFATDGNPDTYSNIRNRLSSNYLSIVFEQPVTIDEMFIDGRGNFDVKMYDKDGLLIYEHTATTFPPATLSFETPLEDVMEARIISDWHNSVHISTWEIYVIEKPKLAIYKDNKLWQIVSDGVWEEISSIEDSVMESLVFLNESDWERLKKEGSDFKILAYSVDSFPLKAEIEVPKTLYQTDIEGYKGIGAIETEVEDILHTTQSLWISAEHQHCTFQYSRDNGKSWHDAELDKVMDISNQEGTQLIIRVHLPSTNSELSSLAYGWA